MVLKRVGSKIIFRRVLAHENEGVQNTNINETFEFFPFSESIFETDYTISVRDFFGNPPVTEPDVNRINARYELVDKNRASNVDDAVEIRPRIRTPSEVINAGFFDMTSNIGKVEQFNVSDFADVNDFVGLQSAATFSDNGGAFQDTLDIRVDVTIE